MAFLYVIATLLLTVYGQLMLKWRINKLGWKLPELNHEKIKALTYLILDPFIFSGFVAAFFASLFWMAAASKFEITKIYPFMSLAPVLVFMLSIPLFHESFSWGKVLGLLFILIGSIITFKW
jgi:undecaprenyl phosphate-alpha-L-ara4N flippase subunit ArnF